MRQTSECPRSPEICYIWDTLPRLVLIVFPMFRFSLSFHWNMFSLFLSFAFHLISLFWIKGNYPYEDTRARSYLRTRIFTQFSLRFQLYRTNFVSPGGRGSGCHFRPAVETRLGCHFRPADRLAKRYRTNFIRISVVPHKFHQNLFDCMSSRSMS